MHVNLFVIDALSIDQREKYIQWLTIAIIFELISYLGGYFYGMADIHEYWSKMPHTACTGF